MAILADNKLELEVTYRGFEHGWVKYGFDCRWDGEPIFNDPPRSAALRAGHRAKWVRCWATNVSCAA